jgi:ATP-dependent helicase/nuclease subunit A
MAAPKPAVKAIVASAGAGKTYRICEDIAHTVKTTAPELILATTFTVKAAAELLERARARLFEAGETEAASRLLGARFGTVNGVCGRLAADFALDLGRSPGVEVIPEEAADRMFSLAASDAIERHAGVLNDLAETLGMTEARFGGAATWRDTVRALVVAARANGLDAEGLSASGARSAESFAALHPPAEDETTLDAAFKRALGDTLAVVPEAPSATALKGLNLLRRAAGPAGFDGLHWSDWVRLASTKAAQRDGADFNAALDRVRTAAAAHASHPRMHRQCDLFIRTMFDCAADSLAAYDAFKARRGLVDFVDQEILALRALALPEAAERLGETLDCVFVDEFQDSSPLQVALFSRLAQIAQTSVWVGDPKQAIYGFRNADSALTQAVFDGVAELSDAPLDRLAISWRSRAGVVEAVNAGFAPALDAMGLPSAQHAFDGSARDEDGYSRPPLAVWQLAGKKVSDRCDALAAGIAGALATPDAFMVKGRGDAATRPLRAGDIGVLCRSNRQVAEISERLSALGIPVAADRGSLIDTPHVQLVLAACRWTADGGDTLALAEMARFFADDPVSDAWLRAASQEDPRAALGALSPITDRLSELRDRQAWMLPSETLDVVAGLSQITALCAAWSDPAACRDDLEALRRFARAWEAERAGSGAAAGLAALCAAVAQESPARPARIDGTAVDLLTYHRAKGLEWPLVVLADLDKIGRPRIFDQPVAQTKGSINWRAPLEGRWLRWWPWPYAAQEKDIPLAAAAVASEIGIAAQKQAVEEDVRLLYVGMTRARDYMVLATPEKGAPWLDVLNAGKAEAHVVLPTQPDMPVRIGGQDFAATFDTPQESPAALVPHPSAHLIPSQRAPVARPSLRLRPSDQGGGARFSILETINLGPRLPLGGAPDMTAVGEAIHGIFGAENSSLSAAARLLRAERILARWNVRALPAQAVLDAEDRLATWVALRWPAAPRVLREVPIHAKLGDRAVSGRIDLLVMTPEGFSIIEHKSFPGNDRQSQSRACGHGPQLALYADAAAAATSARCLGLWVHLPVLGQLVRIGKETAVGVMH